MADLGTIGIAIEVRGREALRQIESDMGVVDKTAKSAARSFEAFERAGLKTADTFKYMSEASKKRLAEEQKITQELIKQRSAAEQLARAKAQSYQSKIGSNLGLGAQGISASASAAAYGAEIDKLSQKYDRIYAATKLYDEQVKELTRAEMLGVISKQKLSKELDQLDSELQQFKNSSDGAALANNRFSQHVNQTSRGLNSFGVVTQQVGYQVGDFFVQVQSGTNPMVAFGQQATQLAGLIPGAFGAAIGIGISLVTAIGAAFMRTSENTKTFQESLSSLEGNITTLNESAGTFTVENFDKMIEKYGVLNQTVYDNISNIERLNTQLISIAQIDVGNLFSESFGGLLTNRIDEMRIAFETSNDQARVLVKLMDDVGSARGPDELIQTMAALRDKLIDTAGGIDHLTVKQAEFVLEIENAIDQANIAKGALQKMGDAAPDGSFLSAAITQAQSLATTLWDAAAAKVAATTSELAPGSSPRPMRRGQGEIIDLRSEDPLGGGSGGGGGGGSVDPIENRMQEVYKYLEQDKYLIEQENLAYQERQTTLEESLRQKLVTLEEYNQIEKDLKTKHEYELASIEQNARSQRLDDAAGFFGSLASVAEAGGGKMVKAASIFSAAQGLINSYTAYTEMLKDPAFIGRPWARFGAAASVLASGLRMVQAIKGVGGGGSGAVSGGGSVGSATVASSASAPAPQTVFIDSLDPDGLYSGQALINLFDAFYDENDKRGKVFMVAR